MTEKYNKDGSISLDGSGVKILRLLDPQGEPDVIECDGIRYTPEQTCKIEQTGCATGICSSCGIEFNASVVTNDPPDYVTSARYCPNCGAKVVE